MEVLKQEFEILFENKDNTEQAFQELLENNSELVPRTFEQNHGIHLDTVFIKVPIGNSYKSDFMFVSKSSVEWIVVHIEIEDPRKKIFTKSGIFTAEFNSATQQVGDWIGWFQKPENQITFNQTIEMIKKPAHMSSNPVTHKFILVYGRRDELDTPQKISAVGAKEHDRFDIMTFDSLFESKHSKLHTGKFKEGMVHIDNKTPLEHHFFNFLNPSQFSIPKREKERIINELRSKVSHGILGKMSKPIDQDRLNTIEKVNSH